MKRFWCLGAGIVLLVFFASAIGLAQPQPSTSTAPTIISVTPGYKSLSITWEIPTTVEESNIVAFDIRHIPSDATDKADANWTVNTDFPKRRTEAVLSGLAHGTQYDVQVRIDLGTNGDWSSTAIGTPKTPSNALNTATALTHNTGVVGHLSGINDRDYFTFTLTEKSEVIMFTAGALDKNGDFTAGTLRTTGVLYHNSGQSNPVGIASEVGSGLSHGKNNFLIARTLAPGTYFLEVTSDQNDVGDYHLFYRAFKDSTNITTARVAKLNTLYNGIIEVALQDGKYKDRDFFTITLTADSSLHIHTQSAFNEEIYLLNESGSRIKSNDDGLGKLTSRGNDRSSEMVVSLAAGKYFVVVKSHESSSAGFYELKIDSIDNSATTIADAIPLEVGVSVAGETTSVAPENYFSFTLQNEELFRIDAMNTDSAKPDLQIELLDSNQNALATFKREITGDQFLAHGHPERLFAYQGLLGPGTYFLKVSGSGSFGPYAIRASTDENFKINKKNCQGKDRRPNAPDDPFYGCQWHLKNRGQYGTIRNPPQTPDINVEKVWADGVTGDGINVHIIDSGFDSSHEDLSGNVITDYNNNFLTGGKNFHDPFEDHGTNVAGIIAAQHNNTGVRGVAPNAKMFGSNFLAQTVPLTDIQHAIIHKSHQTAVSNNSYAVTNRYLFQKAQTLFDRAIDAGIALGYYGKGTSYVFAAGNGKSVADANLNAFANYFGVVAVCGVDTTDARISESLIGSNLWVCAPSRGNRTAGIFTTADLNSYASFGGTSAAAPIVSGVIALIRSANPSLTWRDIKLIIAGSARKNNPSHSGWLEAGLKYGSSTTKYHFNREYGFGVIDAGAAIELASNWQPVPLLINDDYYDDFTDIALSDNAANPVTKTADVQSNIEFIEYVQVDVDVAHHSARDLEFVLVSPSGTESMLVPASPELKILHQLRQSVQGNFRFGSARHLGENPNGEWQLKVRDIVGGHTGTLKDWRLTVYGHGTAPQVVGPVRVTYSENQSGPVATYTANNPNNKPAIAFGVRGLDRNQFVINNQGVLSFSNPPDFDKPQDSHFDNTYNIAVVANDGVHSGVQHVEIVVTDNALPNISPEGATVTYQENATTAVQTFDIPVPTGVSIAWSLSGADSGDFQITNGTLTFISPPDYESPSDSDQDNTYEIVVEATDGTNTASTTFTVQVDNVDEAGTVTLSSEQPQVGAQLTAALSDLDGGITNTNWTWQIRNSTQECSNGQDDWGAISGATTNAYTPVAGDVNCILRATATYTDGHGSSKTQNAVSTNAVQADPNAGNQGTVSPSDNKAVTLTREVAENTPAATPIGDPVRPNGANPTDTFTFALGGAHAASFDIEPATGQLLTKAPLDYEKLPNAYNVTVTATDSSNQPTILKVTINVTDVDEPPVLLQIDPLINPVAFPENSHNFVAQYLGTDHEGETVTWVLSGRDKDHFNLPLVGQSKGSVANLHFNSPPDYEALASRNYRYEVTIIVTETAGQGAQLNAELDVTIQVTDVDEPPEITVGSSYFTRDEGDNRSERYRANDPENQPISWSLEGRDASLFSIDPQGHLRFKTRPVFNSNGGNQYRVNVRATDPAGNSVVIGATIEVTKKQTRQPINNRQPSRPPVGPVFTPVAPEIDSNERPVFNEGASTRRTILENSPANTAVGDPVSATDADGDALRYALVGEHANLFNIDSNNGQITVKSGTILDHESEPNIFRVTVTVTDLEGSGESSEIDVTIAITKNNLPKTVLSYDSNNNGRLDLSEVLKAAFDYTKRQLDQEQLLAVILYYLRS